MDEQFPIIDISRFVNNKNDEFVLEETAKELLKGFSEWGFIYLKGHSIPNHDIETMFKESKRFFQQTFEEKTKVLMDTQTTGHSYGYVPFMVETFQASKPFDLKESFNYMHHIRPDMVDKLPEKFNLTCKTVFNLCHELILDLFDLLTKALALKKENMFKKAHKNIGKPTNTTALRSLYYPGVEDNNILPEQNRCGEHSDYGTITLLFQNTNGLEVTSLFIFYV